MVLLWQNEHTGKPIEWNANPIRSSRISSGIGVWKGIQQPTFLDIVRSRYRSYAGPQPLPRTVQDPLLGPEFDGTVLATRWVLPGIRYSSLLGRVECTTETSRRSLKPYITTNPLVFQTQTKAHTHALSGSFMKTRTSQKQKTCWFNRESSPSRDRVLMRWQHSAKHHNGSSKQTCFVSSKEKHGTSSLICSVSLKSCLNAPFQHVLHQK